MEVPEHLVAEIIDGELITSPRPASPHGWAATAISQDLAGFSRRPNQPGGPGGWWIIVEPELHLDPDVVVPDLGAWRQARMPYVPNVPYFTLAPDWVCEIISPRTGRLDRSRKMAIYARAGVGHFWIVDPSTRTVEVYRLDGDRWIVVTTYGGDDIARPEPFDAVEIALERWWIESTGTPASGRDA